MKKKQRNYAAFIFALWLTVGTLPIMTIPASAASVTTDDMTSLVNAAQEAIGSSAANLGLPAGDWCGYFVGNRMNNSQIAAKLGTTPYNVCRFSASLVSWICVTKDAGVFYVVSPAHQSRLLEVDPRLGSNGRMVARTSGGWSPLPGDILQFSWSDWSRHTFDHTGIVVSASGNMITYVDGNSSSGRVAVHTIRKDSPTIIGHIRFSMGNAPQSAPSTPVPPVPLVSSVEQGDWGVWIPANYYLPLDEKADSTTHISSVYGRPAEYGVHCSERVTLTDGSVRYKGTFTVSGGSPTDFWFTYSSVMEVIVENCAQPAHTEHTWDAGAESTSPTLTTPGTRTYTCTTCGETKSETVPAKASISGQCWSDGDVRWTLTNSGTLTISGTGSLNRLTYDLGENVDLVKRVVVEEGITKLALSFMDCKSIQTIQLPASVPEAHISVFLGCTSLKEVTVSEQNPGLKSVDGVLFTQNMDTLILCPEGRSGSYRIPDGVKTIANASFGGTKLSSVEVPASVTDIDEYSFENGSIMLVHNGSYAEQFAKEHGRAYKVIDAPAKPVPDRVQVTLDLGTFKTNHLDSFKAVKTYSDGIFRDVNSSAWYRDNVSAAYELGLMKGTGENVFEPEKNVTIAETITLAARLHSTYHAGSASFESYDGGNWYDPYVNYARNNGLLSENYDYGHPATREEFVHLLARAFPSEALLPVAGAPAFSDANHIVYGSDVELLSRAGVITGSTDDGVLRFRPNAPISRAEVAAVVTRMAKAELRKS